MPFTDDKTGYFRDAIDELNRMTNKHNKLKSDLRNLVVKMEGVKNGFNEAPVDFFVKGFIEATTVWQSEIEKLLGGKSDAED